MAGGVQNLRALFEPNKSSESPDRGRIGATSAGGREISPRPLSKVRTSFVAVERNGHLGNQLGLRSVSQESNKLQKNSTVTESDEPNESTMADNKIKKPSTIESAINIKTSKQVNKKPEISESSVKKDKVSEKATDLKKEKVIEKIGDAQTDNSLRGNIARNKSVADKKSSAPIPEPISPPKAMSSTPSNQKLVKSPITPTRRRAEVMAQGSGLNHPLKNIPTSGTSSAKPLPSNKPNESKIKNQESSPQTREKMRQAKSPTRPAKLPASFTTHTASSSSKSTKTVTSITKQKDISRASSKYQSPPSRSQSRVSTTSTVLSGTRGQSTRVAIAQSLSRDSTVKSSRQSLTSNDLPSEDTFLARMMRPTTSSASKTAEKTISTNNQPKITTKSSVKNVNRDTSVKYETKKQSSVPSRDKETTPRTKYKAASNTKVSSKNLMAQSAAKPIDAGKKDYIVSTVATSPPKMLDGSSDSMEVRETQKAEESSTSDHTTVSSDKPSDITPQSTTLIAQNFNSGSDDVLTEPFAVKAESSSAEFGSDGDVLAEPIAVKAELSRTDSGSDVNVLVEPVAANSESSSAEFGSDGDVLAEPIAVKAELSRTDLGSDGNVLVEPVAVNSESSSADSGSDDVLTEPVAVNAESSSADSGSDDVLTEPFAVKVESSSTEVENMKKEEYNGESVVSIKEHVKTPEDQKEQKRGVLIITSPENEHASETSPAIEESTIIDPEFKNTPPMDLMVKENTL